MIFFSYYVVVSKCEEWKRKQFLVGPRRH